MSRQWHFQVLLDHLLKDWIIEIVAKGAKSLDGNMTHWKGRLIAKKYMRSQLLRLKIQTFTLVGRTLIYTFTIMGIGSWKKKRVLLAISYTITFEGLIGVLENKPDGTLRPIGKLSSRWPRQLAHTTRREPVPAGNLFEENTFHTLYAFVEEFRTITDKKVELQETMCINTKDFMFNAAIDFAVRNLKNAARVNCLFVTCLPKRSRLAVTKRRQNGGL